MIVSLTCTYCNHYFERYVPKKSDLAEAYCIKRGDQYLKIRDLEKTKVDYYAGAPKFPSSALTKDLLDYILVGSEY